jgi:hypothetical protein
MTWERPRHRLPGEPPAEPRVKKFDWKGPWYRQIVGDVTSAKWKLFAELSGATPAEVFMVVTALREKAAATKANGDIGDFNVRECAISIHMQIATVEKIVLTLVGERWLEQGYIMSWVDEQGSSGDAAVREGNRLRQANKRMRDRARHRIETGRATPEDLTLVAGEELAAFERFKTGASHVTGSTVSPSAAAGTAGFRPIDGADDATNVEAARLWLFGAGENDWGVSSRIVGEALNMTRLNGLVVVGRWCEQLGRDFVALASIITAAHEQLLTGKAFENVITGGITALVNERRAGTLPLPLGHKLQTVRSA